MAVFRRQSIITRVQARGVRLALQRELGKKRVKKALALEAAEAVRPQVEHVAKTAYLHALGDLRKRLVEGPPHVGGPKSFHVTDPHGRSHSVITPPWAPLSDRYARSKVQEKQPGAGEFWRREGHLLPALREGFIEGRGAWVGLTEFLPGVPPSGAIRGFLSRLSGRTATAARVEWVVFFQAQSPLLDTLLRQSFASAEPAKAIYNAVHRWQGLDKTTGKEDTAHLRKVLFFEAGPSLARPQLYRPMLGYIMAAHGRLLHEAMRKL